ncbi:MAG: zinc ribbon domain-containing protein, partial [Anaerolineales bacterium]
MIRCPKCNTENRKGARFCGRCGASLSVVCPQCGTELPSDLRFCDACGAELRAAEPAAAVPETIPDRVKRLIPSEYAERLLATRGQVQAERR